MEPQQSVGADAVEQTSSSSADPSADGGGDICRDFLRHVCKRGRRCRYRHPETSPPPTAAQLPQPPSISLASAMSAGSLDPLVFCHDYQNGGCQRPSCRFVHCSREEEVTFRTTGRLPDRFLLTLVGDSEELQAQQPPVCKDHLKGECKRGGRCRFRHLDAAPTLALPAVQPPLSFDFLGGAGALDPSSAAAAATAFLMMNGAPGGGIKRRRLEFEPAQLPTLAAPAFNFLAAQQQQPQPPAAALAEALQAENALLKRRLEELRRQCGELMVTNELLAEQNARLRQQQQPQQQHTPHSTQLEAMSALPNAYSDFAYPALFAFPQAVTQTVTSAGVKGLPVSQLQ